MNDQAKPKIYLAGPTVFFRESEAAFADLERLCRARDLNPVRPAEPVDSSGQVLGGAAAARYLFEQNTLRIRAASGVLADLRPFRGELEPDSGTVFEVGFAHALGKPVAAVLADDRDWGTRVRSVCGVGQHSAMGLEMDARYDMLIEDFGGRLNLMLSESCRVFQNASEALDWLATTVASVGPL
jgi:nucleoside 2-deoxyribosyltransferase